MWVGHNWGTVLIPWGTAGYGKTNNAVMDPSKSWILQSFISPILYESWLVDYLLCKKHKRINTFILCNCCLGIAYCILGSPKEGYLSRLGKLKPILLTSPQISLPPSGLKVYPWEPSGDWNNDYSGWNLSKTWGRWGSIYYGGKIKFISARTEQQNEIISIGT